MKRQLKRQQLIQQIDSLDRKLNQRIENINELAQDTHHTFKKIPPVWLISFGAAAGALTAAIAPKNFYLMGVGGHQSFPLVSKAFGLGKQLGAGE